MQKERAVLQLHLKDMEQKEDWRILLLLARKLKRIRWIETYVLMC